MPAVKCTEEDVIEVVVRAVEEGRPIKSRRELVERLMEHCNYSSPSNAYRLIKILEGRGALRYITGYGYIVSNPEHDDLIMRTYELLLDILVSRAKPVSTILSSEGFTRYYGRELSEAHVLDLMVMALEHAITASPEWVARVGMVVDSVRELRELRGQRDMVEMEINRIIYAEREGLIREDFADEVRKLLNVDETRKYEVASVLNAYRELIVRNGCYKVAESSSYPYLRTLCKWMEGMDAFEREAPRVHKLFKLTERMVQLEDRIKELERKIWGPNNELERDLVNWIRKFSLESRLAGYLKGWCESCGKSSTGGELKPFIEEFIERKVIEFLRSVFITSRAPRIIY
jgi:DNA-binding transcriptional regulator YhcF (GntR family)